MSNVVLHLEVLEGPTDPQPTPSRPGPRPPPHPTPESTQQPRTRAAPPRRQTETTRASASSQPPRSRPPPTNRLLTDLLPPSSHSERYLPSEIAEHDPGLLLSRNRWGFLFSGLRQNGLNCPATKPDGDRSNHRSTDDLPLAVEDRGNACAISPPHGDQVAVESGNPSRAASNDASGKATLVVSARRNVAFGTNCRAPSTCTALKSTPVRAYPASTNKRLTRHPAAEVEDEVVDRAALRQVLPKPGDPARIGGRRRRCGPCRRLDTCRRWRRSRDGRHPSGPRAPCRLPYGPCSAPRTELRSGR